MSKEKRYEMTHNVLESEIYGLLPGFTNIELLEEQQYIVFTRPGTVRYVPVKTPAGKHGYEMEIEGFNINMARNNQQQSVRSSTYHILGDYQTSLSNKICFKFTYYDTGKIRHVYIPQDRVTTDTYGRITSIEPPDAAVGGVMPHSTKRAVKHIRGGRKTRKRNGRKTRKRSPR